MAKIMKITGSNPMVSSTTTAKPDVEKAVADKKGVPVSELKPELQSVGLSEALSGSSEVDMAAVERVRDAIAEGTVSLDPDVLAEAIMGMHL